eukprot:2594598-Heterocapsa_arctica.AAC.1
MMLSRFAVAFWLLGPTIVMAQWHDADSSDSDVVAAGVADLELVRTRPGPGRPRGSNNVATVLKRNMAARLQQDAAMAPELAMVVPGELPEPERTPHEKQALALVNTLLDHAQGYVPRMWTMAQLADTTGVNPKAIRERLLQLASSIVSGQQETCNRLLSLLASLKRAGSITLPAFFKFRKYDETPMKLM